MRPDTPPVAADIIIELHERDEKRIVLVERRFEPLGWALPGGFVDHGETVAAAARREAREETGLDVELTALLGVYSAPERDSRGQTVSIVFVGRAVGVPVAADDARNVMLTDPANPPPLVFDHARILADYRRLASGAPPQLPD